MTPYNPPIKDVKVVINTVEGQRFYEVLGTNPIPLPGQFIDREPEKNSILTEPKY